MKYLVLPTAATWIADSAAAVQVPGGRVAALKANFGKHMPVTDAVRPPLLKAIDDLLRDSEKAHSSMARMNFLALLDRAIAAWHAANPASEASVALREVVTQKLALREPNSRYNRAICVGYHIGCNYEKATGTSYNWNPIDGDRNTSYFRHSPNDQTDMQTKCGELFSAITAARDAIAMNPVMADDTRTLKIFMAPEFFFRGRNGAYSPEIVADIIPKMQALGTGGSTYKDWLFVFGTGIASIETEVTYCPTCGNGTHVKFSADPLNRGKTVGKCTLHPAVPTDLGTYGAEIQNVALVQHGTMTHVVAKEYVSHIDFKKSVVRSTTGGGGNLKVIAPQGSRDVNNYRGPMSRVHSDERAGGCIFTIDGITIGLEVCLDHMKGGSAGGQYGRASDYARIIQFLLIPSYGMSINGQYNCKPGGFAFNVDGRNNGSSEVGVNGGAAPGFYSLGAGRGSMAIYTPCAIPG